MTLHSPPSHPIADILQMILKLETITKEREMHMEKLWKEFQSVLNSYLKYTEEYRDEYIDLRNRDAEDTRSIQDHYNGKSPRVATSHSANGFSPMQRSQS